ncbi:molybdenum cofactor guanylyltransferase [Rhizobium tarimense]|nr:molybdenum cofactor guanylyltransferase [Pseudorhizobium tarimense]
MGSDKLLLPFGSGTLLSHIAQRLAPQVSEVAVNAPSSMPLPPAFRRVPDTLPGQPGPLGGVLAGLHDIAARQPGTSHLLTVPSDAPFFPDDLAARLQAAASAPDIIAVASSEGRTHPVFGLWPVSAADDLETWLTEPDNRRLSAFLARHPTVAVHWQSVETPVGPLDPFINLNTPDNLEAARRYLEAMR